MLTAKTPCSFLRHKPAQQQVHLKNEELNAAFRRPDGTLAIRSRTTSQVRLSRRTRGLLSTVVSEPRGKLSVLPAELSDTRKIYLTSVQRGTVACCAPGVLWEGVLPHEQGGTFPCRPQYAMLPAVQSFMWLELQFASRQGDVCAFSARALIHAGCPAQRASTSHPLSTGVQNTFSY